MRSRGLSCPVALAPTIADAGSQYFRDIASLKGWDILLAASDWQQHRFVQTSAALEGKIKIWPCGVDTAWWSPGGASRTDILLYVKRAPSDLIQEVRQQLHDAGFNSKTITYGSYLPSEFRDSLQKSKAAIFFSDWESQGIALTESWSCDVPTIVWKPDPANRWNYTSPWITRSTGSTFSEPVELLDLLQPLKLALHSPRKWVMENMSLERTAYRLLEVIGNIAF